MLTPDDVRDARFRKPPIGKRGYNAEEVDAFLDELESTLRGTGGRMTAAQVREAAFGKPPIGKRGYDEDEVDNFLDLAELQLSRGGPAPSAPPNREAPPPRAERQRPGMVEPKRRWWQR